MTDYLQEHMYSDYFAFEFLLGDYGADLKKLFGVLGKIYSVSEKALAEMYSLCSKDEIKEISGEKEYFRYCRSRAYFAEDAGADDKESDVITVKGNTISALIKADERIGKKHTAASMRKLLVETALEGDVRIMRLVGLLMAEGVFFGENKQKGINLIKTAADWNDVDALLTYLYYEKEEKFAKEYMNKLEYLVYAKDLTGDVTKAGGKKLTGKFRTPKEAALLEELFRTKALKSDTYSHPHARILTSEVLDVNDKRQILLVSGKEIPPAVSELPLMLKDRKTEVDAKAFDNLPFDRKEEKEAALQALGNIDLRAQSVYRPVCFVCKSAYLLNKYAAAVESYFAEMNVVKIETSELDASDFEASPNSIFVRYCDENCDNAYLIFFRGKTNPEMEKELREFLGSESRSRIRLNTPSVTLDLKQVLPVCFADRAHETALAEICDVVTIADVAKEEMSALIDAILAEKAKAYEVPSIELDGELRDKLTAGSIDDAEAAIDGGVRKNRKKGKKLVLTAKNTVVGKAKPVRHLGFGGASNEG